MPAPVYARYVPPNSGKASGSAKSEAIATTEVTTKPPKSLKRKEKALKKDRKERVPKAEPKEKSGSKKRKRKEIEAESEIQTQEENKAISKRHEAILAKFQKSSKISEKVRESQPQEADDTNDQEETVPELHGLTPLPQLTQAPELDYKPTFSALPSWLSKPISVRPDQSKAFKDLISNSKLLSNLEKKGFRDAFPVQSALISLLLPGRESYNGDICVSAATGSGKTLGYVVPLIENLKKKLVTRLRAVIVVPTRELVLQAQRVAEFCAAGTGVKFGTALGSTNIEDERDLLVNWGQKFDPEGAAEMYATAKERIKTGLDEDDTLFEDIRRLLPGHVPEYSSAVDILICTPGRLVDHIQKTVGFSLSHVEYLVIDEADRLLDESFQRWVEVVLGAVDKKDENSARNRSITITDITQQSRAVKKIILSATMTRDLSKLATLKLRRPALVAVVGMEDKDSQPLPDAHPGENATHTGAVDLPPTLREVAIPVGDGANKPLYLLELLIRLLDSSQPLLSNTQIALQREKSKASSDMNKMADDSDSNTTSTDAESDSSSGIGDSIASSPSPESSDHLQKRQHTDTIMTDVSSGKSTTHTAEMVTTRILVFTKDNEDAMRLSHLIPAMHPSYAQIIGTLTKASSSAGRRTLAAFKSGKVKVLIASDRASRGLDVHDLTDVVSYDMPHSLTSYVHRVGRTARAGKPGSAWTFFIDSEARWFWNSIARGHEIRRSHATVERMKIDSQSFDDKKGIYERALRSLKTAVHGTEK